MGTFPLKWGAEGGKDDLLPCCISVASWNCWVAYASPNALLWTHRCTKHYVEIDKSQFPWLSLTTPFFMYSYKQQELRTNPKKMPPQSWVEFKYLHPRVSAPAKLQPAVWVTRRAETLLRHYVRTSSNWKSIVSCLRFSSHVVSCCKARTMRTVFVSLGTMQRNPSH